MKKNRSYVSISALTLLLGIFYSCFTTNKVSVQNLAEMYHSDYHYLHPQFMVHQVGDSSAMLYYKINNEELLYIRRNVEDSFYASARIVCKVTQSYESSQMLDSSSVVLKFSSITNTKKGYSIGSLPLKLKYNQSYIITAYTTDLTSKKQEINYINSESSDNLSSRNFLITNKADGQPVFPDYIDSNASLAIAYNKPVQRLKVSYYKREFPLAAPPFAVGESAPLKFNADSSFTIYPGPDNVFSLNIRSKGFYHIQVDTLNHNGITIYRFPKYYPTVGTTAELIPPLRYITSNEEYTRLKENPTDKKAIDNFWLNLAGSQERAKALIRVYYNRVQDANKFFTSYVEGWKTDRGMMYIIFGPPSVVYRNSYSENWIYGEDRNFMQLNFVFHKVNNPFTSNDYMLDRSAQFRNVWYNAVDIWRQGRVY